MINQHAIIHPSAKIADEVTIGPWTIIGENVEIGSGTIIGSNVNISKNTRIGINNTISSHAVLGTDPQHTGYQNEETWLEIGDHNIIREFVTINRGTKDVGITIVGSHNYLMSYSHIAHDCVIGNHVIFANLAMIAGHVRVGDFAVLGAYAGVHQFVNIGAYSFLGRATKIYQDILPYMLVTGNPGAPRKLNSVGLRRQGFNLETMSFLKEAFRIIFRRGLPQQEILAELQKLSHGSQEIQALHNAIRVAKRGYARQDVELEV